MRWLDQPDANVLAMLRYAHDPEQPSVIVVVNTGEAAAHLPAEWGTQVLLASGHDVAHVSDNSGTHVVIGAETSVWLRG